MSRHNRRRTRGGRKHSAARSTAADSDDNFDGTVSGAVLVPAFSQAPLEPRGFAAVQDVIPRVPATPQRAPLLNRGSAASVRVWHNRYLAWQNRDRKQKEEMARLEIERAKIFGGGWNDDGSDEGSGVDEEDDHMGLEEKMLEYFGGLEWLDT